MDEKEKNESNSEANAGHSTERTPLLHVSYSQGVLKRQEQLNKRPASSALAVPHMESQPSMRRTASYGTQLPSPGSWSNYFRPSPYTEENKPNRRPFHIPRTPTGAGTLHCQGVSEGVGSLPDEDPDTGVGGFPRRHPAADPHAPLYTRYRYYSRLRAPAQPDDHALVIPDHIVPIHLFVPFIPGSQTVGPDGKQASYITVISIWNTMMGTSLLTMPWAFGNAGFLGGLVIMLGMAALCLFTAYKILTVQRVAGMSGPLLEASSLCRELVGGVWGRFLEGGAVIFSILTLLGAVIVYWVLMSNFLYNTGQVIHYSIYKTTLLVDHHNSTYGLLCPANNSMATANLSLLMDGSSTAHLLVPVDDDHDYEPTAFERYWSLRFTVPLYLLIVFVPLLCIKNTRIFSYFNSLGAVSVLAIYSFVVVKAFTWGFNLSLTDPDSPYYLPLIKDEFMALSGTLSLAYFIHNCIITIMKGNRYQENNVRDLTLAYFMVMGTYVPIGVFFYASFPLPKFCLADNFLNNFPPHDIVLAVVRVFLLFQMLTVFPLLCVFLRTQLFCYFRGSASSPPSFMLSASVNAVLLAACVSVAILYPNVGFIIRWVGAFSGLVYVFILPCGLYMKALYSKGELSALSVIGHSIIIALGVSNFLAQFFL